MPIFFYDLSEKKHTDYIRVLKVRAIVEIYKNNEISNEDIENLKEIVDFANESKDTFVLDEISKFDCINNIFQGKAR